MLYTLIITSFTLEQARASTFPIWNQQCRDDAGPSFVDDEPSLAYHFGSAAQPVLINGECPHPLTAACSARSNPQTAFLEGPISCGNQGWYCRILPDENWDPMNLVNSMNFGHCNNTEAFQDAGWDRSGACHGSNADSTYYWFVRDYWFRRMNGRLRCCCGWNDLEAGRVANRCDFRREVGFHEDLNTCRDANEEHNQEYNGGCHGASADGIDKPIPENESMCWEVTRFGFQDREVEQENGNEENQQEAAAEDAENVDEVAAEDEENVDQEFTGGQCQDDPTYRFRGHPKKSCRWVAQKPKARCTKRFYGRSVSEFCRATCDACSSVDSTLVFPSYLGRRRKN